MTEDLKIVIDKMFNSLFTKRCELCGEVIEFDKEVCDACKTAEKNEPPYCVSCGLNKKNCTCDKHKNEYKQIVAPYIYDENLKRAINHFKSSYMPFLSKRFAKDMAECISKSYNVDFDMITYIPMTKKDYRKRDYNQSYLLAKEISDILNIELEDLLIKVRKTKSQKSLSARERKVNVYGAFDVKDKEIVIGKNILLIDDLKTTGSTLNECAKMLNIYGASGVWSATIAIAPEKKKR